MAETSTPYDRGLRISVIGLIANAGLATIKLVAGLLGNCYALVADAVESMADIFSSIVVWSGLRIASRPADDSHPYGHGKAEALAAMLVALMLMAAGVGIAVQAVRQVMSDHSPPAAFTLWVLIAVIVVKEGLFRIVRRVARATGSHAVLADAWHHRSDAITSAAAGIGISVALLGGEGYEVADDWAALFASGVIVVNAVRLLMPPLHELMDAEPTHVVDGARTVAENVDGVGAVEKIFARKSGLRYWVDMHLEVDPDMSVRRAHDIAHVVKEQVRAAMPEVCDVLIHVEPHAPAEPAPAAPSHAPNDEAGS